MKCKPIHSTNYIRFQLSMEVICARMVVPTEFDFMNKICIGEGERESHAHEYPRITPAAKDCPLCRHSEMRWYRLCRFKEG